MAEDHGAPEAGQLSMVWTRGHRESPKSERRKESVAGQCRMDQSTAPINSRLNVVVRSPAPFGLGRNGCWLSRGSQLPRALPNHFFAMLLPERPQKGSTQLL